MQTAWQRCVFPFVLGVVALAPRAAWAVQTHGGAEGLVAHELGHVLFTAGLLYVLLGGGAARWGAAGRRPYRAFLILAIAWNVLTFTGHFLAAMSESSPLVRGADGARIFAAHGGWDWVFYLTYFDHLLLVPALALLFVALLRWLRSEDEAS